MNLDLAHDDTACGECGKVGFHAGECRAWNRWYIAYIPNNKILAYGKSMGALENHYSNVEGALIEEKREDGDYPHYLNEFYFPKIDDEI